MFHSDKSLLNVPFEAEGRYVSIDPLAFRFLVLILALSLLQALLVSFEVDLTRGERNRMKFALFEWNFY